MAAYVFEVEGKVVGKQRPRMNSYTGCVYTPNKTKDYELLVAQSFKVKYPRAKVITGRVAVEIIVYMKPPKSTPKKKLEEMLNNTISPTKKPDIDNVGKSILDGLNKLIIDDDNQVVRLLVEKRYGETDKAVIKIEEF